MQKIACAFSLLLIACMFCTAVAEELDPQRLGIVYAIGNASSVRIAHYYAAQRRVPPENLVGLDVPERSMIDREELKRLRTSLMAQLPSSVQSLLLVWSRPFAVECMSVTTAIAAGYQAEFCEPGCARTKPNPLFDTQGWLPADTTGWLPAMLLPSDDEELARAVIDRGVLADGSRPSGTLFLIRTGDAARNVRAGGYDDAAVLVGRRVNVRQMSMPPQTSVMEVIGYFTGISQVEELPRLRFRPGAVADHLTSTGGVLDSSSLQMTSLEWLRQGATASYGTVSEPCNIVGKFPSPAVFMDHYLRGDTLLEAYWKSVAMPGQGLFIGEPLARPYPAH